MTILAMTTAAILALSLAPPPPPPLGWETEITEGFDPPIEEVMVDHYYAEDAERIAHAEAWGGEAVPVLQRLYADPKWAEYRRVIRDYIERLDAPATPGDALERLREVLVDFPPGSNRRLEALNNALADAIRADAEQARKLFLEAFAESDEGIQGWLLLASVARSGQESAAILDDLLPHAHSDEVRSTIEGRMAHAASIARAHEPIAIVLGREARGDSP